jgi:propanol-preferring alcohol dehydrogenase
MQALQLVGGGAEPRLVEVPDPVAGPGEVVVRVGGAGVCHSDLHLLYDLGAASLPWAVPFTLGHENAGWIHELGVGVSGWEVGQPVAVYGPWGCGRCARCVLGSEQYCEDPASAPVAFGGGGLGLDGGMATYLKVPSARLLVALPDALSPQAAAPLTDAGLTSYHAVRRSAHKLGPTSTAVVIGVGGLGHLAIQLLVATTAARVVAIDPKPEALALAVELGADLAIAPGPETAADVRDFAGGRGADVVLDLVGSDATIAMGIAVARMLGDVTLVGIAGGAAPFGFFTVPYEVSLQSVYWGSRPELVEVLDLAARGHVAATTTVSPLRDAPDVYRRLRDGAVMGRAVIDPSAG